MGHERAAIEASSYWRGGRVRGHEPNLPAPLIGPNLSIDYQGWGQPQECLEYYLDKHYEEKLRRTLYRHQWEVEQRNRVRESNVQTQGTAPRGIVAYLLVENQGRTIHRDLLLSLHCLRRFFGRYPAVIFYTKESTADELQRLRSEAPKGLELLFEEVTLEFPPELLDTPGGPNAYLSSPKCMLEDHHWWSTHLSCGCRCPAWRQQCWPLLWMHATRFFTAGMFRTSTFQSGNYDFFLRLDSDLFFVMEPTFDPFQIMSTNGCGLVYDKLSREAPGCYDGFDQRSLDYLHGLGVQGTLDNNILHVGRGPAAAGGQWTAGDARFFTGSDYLRFADYHASGIYSSRWADQLFMVRALALFGPMSSLASVPWQGEAPRAESAICVRPLFSWDEPDTEGFVHQKGGFYNRELLATCGAEEVFAGEEKRDEAADAQREP